MIDCSSINSLSATFKDRKTEWDFRKIHGFEITPRLNFLLLSLIVVNLVIGASDIVNSFHISEIWILSLFRIMLIAGFSIMYFCLKFDGLRSRYYSLLSTLVFLSIVMTSARFYLFSQYYPERYTLELGVSLLVLITIIRSIFMLTPMHLVYSATFVHNVIFFYFFYFYEGALSTAYDFQMLNNNANLSIYIVSVVFILFASHQYNILIRKGYFAKNIALKDALDATKKLEQLRRVEQTFLAESNSQVLAHEIKNPLSVLSSYAQILQYESKPSPSVFAISQKIILSTKKIDDIIKRIRKFSLGSTDFKRLKIKTVIEAGRVLWQASAGRSGSSVRIFGDNPIICVDKLLMQGAVANFIRNAVEAKENGKVEVQIKQLRGFVHIIISNDKTFHAPKNDIFAIFSPSNKKRGGTGIGLAFAKNVIEKHSGSIKYESKDGHTYFTIVLLKQSKVV